MHIFNFVDFQILWKKFTFDNFVTTSVMKWLSHGIAMTFWLGSLKTQSDVKMYDDITVLFFKYYTKNLIIQLHKNLKKKH